MIEFDSIPGSLLGGHDRLAHVGIACHRLEDAMRHLGALFDVRWTPIADDTAPNLFDASGPSDWTARRSHAIGGMVHFELLEGSPGSTWDTPKIAVTHHVAYWSHDVGADVRALRADQWDVELEIRDERCEPTEFAYLTKPGCVRVELIDVKRRPAHHALIARG
jgi:Glyoxalase/Bleomycin resistance protein/Dioxygenase superfamily